MRVIFFLLSIVLMLAGAYQLITGGFSVGWFLGLFAGVILLIMSIASFVGSARQEEPSIVPNFGDDDDDHANCDHDHDVHNS
jgi:hypothetical protein